MNQPQSLFADLRSLFASLPSQRRKQLMCLVTFMLLTGVMEMATLGAIVPFLALLADPVEALQRPLIKNIAEFLGWTNEGSLKSHLAVLFASAALSAGLLRFLMVYVTSKLNFTIGHEIGAEVYRRSFYQPYEIHIARNSSETIGAISRVDNVVFVVFSLLNSCSSLLIACCIACALVLIDPAIALMTLGGFGAIYAAVSLVTRKYITRSGAAMNAAYTKRVQSIQEGLGGIRDVLLDQTQPLFLNRFNEADLAMRRAQAGMQIVAPTPRIVVEALGIVLIATLGYFRAGDGGISMAIPTLGALALGAQRLMPLLQQGYQGWVYTIGSRDVLANVVRILNQPLRLSPFECHARQPFEHTIVFEDVCFTYPNSHCLVLNNVNITINKGDRVGIVGPTGSGKSTAMDILLGLLEPSTGRVLVDGVPLVGDTRQAWQRNVAHVPQSIFLTEASFAENIAFGLPKEAIDMERVREAANKAQIAEFIEATPHGYMSRVGERGVNLSGGQRQRIGIARALYKQAAVLVFDEATSALDGETEYAVMQAIGGLGRDITVILIAHRLSTLQSCDLIYGFKNGVATSTGGYETLLEERKSA
ncbi:ABC transporter ATP-binding protein [Noviherbaspirillum malthae]|uniref:ABC transporter ATP-binding protein n=1 Tax=Noviherbaspirillum malthae TaxID=1260987 RepID=UPI00188E6C4B|nr:ABC transporter ATP-binding protein [Noviherbaspirillum malthae]